MDDQSKRTQELAEQLRNNREALDEIERQVRNGERVLSFEEARQLVHDYKMNYEKVMSIYRLSKSIANGEVAIEEEHEEQKPDIPAVTKEEVDALYQTAMKTRRPSDILKYMKSKRLYKQWLEAQEGMDDDQ